LNKLINIKVSFARSVCNTLFEMSEMFDALSAFTFLIVCLTSFFEMCKSNDTIKSINESAMLLMFV